MELELEQRKQEYIKKKYHKLSAEILALIDTPEKLKNETKNYIYGLRMMYHYLDSEIDNIIEILKSNNGTKIINRIRPRCDSCDEGRISSPTFPDF